MELRMIDQDEQSHVFIIPAHRIVNVVQQFTNESLLAIDQIPLATRSIKTVLKLAMNHFHVLNPDPKNLTDIDAVIGIGMGKLMDYLEVNGLDIRAVKKDSQALLDGDLIETRDK